MSTSTDADFKANALALLDEHRRYRRTRTSRRRRDMREAWARVMGQRQIRNGR